MTYAEKQILPALIPIIEANGGQLQADAIPEYVLLLFATGGFIDKAEIKAAFNEFAWRGAFRLKGEKHK